MVVICSIGRGLREAEEAPLVGLPQSFVREVTLVGHKLLVFRGSPTAERRQPSEGNEAQRSEHMPFHNRRFCRHPQV